MVQIGLYMKTLILIVTFASLLWSCKQTKENKSIVNPKEVTSIIKPKYANGFQIVKFPNSTRLDIYKTGNSQKDTLRFFFSSDPIICAQNPGYIKTPIKRLIASSTTDIPLLEALNSEDILVGFPETDYISSTKTRTRIAEGKIRDIGSLQHLNTEAVLDINPELFVAFSVNEEQKEFHFLKQAGIPVLMNGSWLEQHPLGRAEWMKLYGVLCNKETLAETIFNGIEKQYLELKSLAAKTKKRPTIFSGSLYKDVWYVAAGESYVAQLLKDANLDYLWKDSKGTGSLALSFETVLAKAEHAQYWLGGGSFDSIEKLVSFEEKYQLFDAVKQGHVYSKDLKKGVKKGALYYEEGALRADWVLSDLIHFMHPKVLPDYEPHFFQKLK